MLRYLGILVAWLAWHIGPVVAQENAGGERSLVFKAGPAFERSLSGRNTTWGGTVSVEGTVIENWLELELGATRLSSGGRRADSVGLEFKKPFRLSPTAELMIGVGPSAGREFRGGVSPDPTRKRPSNR